MTTSLGDGDATTDENGPWLLFASFVRTLSGARWGDGSAIATASFSSSPAVVFRKRGIPAKEDSEDDDDLAEMVTVWMLFSEPELIVA